MDDSLNSTDGTSNKRTKWLRTLELVSFAVALFFVVPPVPSTGYSIDFLPAGIIASAWGINQAVNVLYYCVE